MTVLAIETSCDETAAAVLAGGGRELLSDVVHSQIAEHEPYGGVVPEIASRCHAESVRAVVERALADAGVDRGDLEGIAVTSGPGLVGSLLVGVNFAKGLGRALSVPVLGVHHLEGHLVAPLLEHREEDVFPCVALIVSGGHTSLFHAEGFGRYRSLGRTLDDAAGEAFDKVARILDLGYPGGPEIDRAARGADPAAFDLPRPALGRHGHEHGLDFSFSGLKTAVRLAADALDDEAYVARRGDLAASFQEAVVDVLVAKTVAALAETGAERAVVTGGVAANRRLRERLLAEGERRGFALLVPPIRHCTDNAAMIGAAGARRLAAGEFSGPELDARSVWPLEGIA